MVTSVISLLHLLSLAIPTIASSLSSNFYTVSCPLAETIVRNSIRSQVTLDPTVPGKLLRLLFHDCMVEGCDASVLLQGEGTERKDPANASLGGFQVVEGIKRVVEMFCPGIVSCADILVLAARDSVQVAGGPSVVVPLGRRDGRLSSASNVRSNIVDTSFTVDEMIDLFSSKGLSIDDLVVLSGAHTIGLAHCSAFSDRFKQDSEGKLVLIDNSLEASYAEALLKRCPANASSSVTVNNDPQTSFVFDNQYYHNLMEGKGLFQSDSELFNDARTKDKVQILSSSQESFFNSWAASFVKLSSVGVKFDDQGEIRKSCEAINR